MIEHGIQIVQPSYKHLGTFQAHCHPGGVVQVAQVAEGKMSNIFAQTTRRASACWGFPIDIKPTFLQVSQLEFLSHLGLQFFTCLRASLVLPHVYVLAHLLHMLFARRIAHSNFLSASLTFFLFFLGLGGCLLVLSLFFSLFQWKLRTVWSGILSFRAFLQWEVFFFPLPSVFCCFSARLLSQLGRSVTVLHRPRHSYPSSKVVCPNLRFPMFRQGVHTHHTRFAATNCHLPLPLAACLSF